MTTDERGRCRAAETLLRAAGVDARVAAVGADAEIASVDAAPAALSAVQGLSGRIKALGFRYVALALDTERRSGGHEIRGMKEHRAGRMARHDEPDAEGP